MAALLVLLALVVLCVLGAVSGVDSRPVESNGHRPNWS
jgi:hypothetical protein